MADAAVISEVTAAAFATMEISNHTEQFIIEALRAAQALLAGGDKSTQTKDIKVALRLVRNLSSNHDEQNHLHSL